MTTLDISYDCYVSLGANLGDRADTLRKALEKISSVKGIEFIKASAIYETEPWGKLDQPAFLNAVVHLRVSLKPQDLLADLQCIESELGRVRLEHWGARTIDLDILHIPGYASDEERLKLPHPYLFERAFVLVPFAELAGEVSIAGKTIAAYCDKVEGKNGVKLFGSF